MSIKEMLKEALWRASIIPVIIILFIIFTSCEDKEEKSMIEKDSTTQVVLSDLQINDMVLARIYMLSDTYNTELIKRGVYNEEDVHIESQYLIATLDTTYYEGLELDEKYMSWKELQRSVAVSVNKYIETGEEVYLDEAYKTIYHIKELETKNKL